jgi:hypothetical protein
MEEVLQLNLLTVEEVIGPLTGLCYPREHNTTGVTECSSCCKRDERGETPYHLW